jgi:ubiquinone/menaquinone biosynthesis C-methylase UbiE
MTAVADERRAARVSGDTPSAEEAKQRAITVHSNQAAEFARRYSELARDPYGSCFSYSRHRLRAAMARLLPERGEGLQLLDIGCGIGHHLADLRPRGFDVAGVDASAEMVALARTINPGVPIAQADVESLPFASAEFDVVLCIEVLRYLPEVRGCLREMARVLRPGGQCLVTATPVLNLNGYWLVNRLVSTLGVPGFVNLRQLFHGSNRLRREFEAAGFIAPRVHGVYVGPINWVERLLPRALPAVLRRWERLDSSLADQPVLREFSNMFLIHAVRARG